MNIQPQPLVKVENLRMYFPAGNGFFSRTKSYIHAVDDVAFEIPTGNRWHWWVSQDAGRRPPESC